MPLNHNRSTSTLFTMTFRVPTVPIDWTSHTRLTEDRETINDDSRAGRLSSSIHMNIVDLFIMNLIRTVQESIVVVAPRQRASAHSALSIRKFLADKQIPVLHHHPP